MTSSVIYYSTPTRKNVIYLLVNNATLSISTSSGRRHELADLRAVDFSSDTTVVLAELKVIKQAWNTKHGSQFTVAYFKCLNSPCFLKFWRPRGRACRFVDLKVHNVNKCKQQWSALFWLVFICDIDVLTYLGNTIRISHSPSFPSVCFLNFGTSVTTSNE